MSLKIKDYRFHDTEVSVAQSLISETKNVSAIALDGILAQRLNTSIARARVLRLGLGNKYYCTGEDKKELQKEIAFMRGQGYTINEIADELDITPRQVSNYLRNLGLAGSYLNRHRPKPKPTPVNESVKNLKSCLGWCGKEFHSDNGHRYCPTCLPEYERRCRETAPPRGRIVLTKNQC